MIINNDITTILFLYSKKNIHDTPLINDIIYDLNSLDFCRKYINCICIDNKEILNWLNSNESGLSINNFPILVVKHDSIDGMKKSIELYNLEDYHIVKKLAYSLYLKYSHD